MVSGTQTQSHPPTITGAQALKVAESDAEQAYGDLSLYQIRVRMEEDGWHVDYELNDSRLQGGGPHYIINPSDGSIIRKRYEQ